MPALRRGRDQGRAARFSLARHAPRAARGDADAATVVASRLLPRLSHLLDAIAPDRDDGHEASQQAVERTLDRLRSDPDGSLSIAGPDGWTGASVMALGMLEVAAAAGQPFDLQARPRITLGERAVLAAIGIDGLRARPAAGLLFTDEDDVHRLLRNGLLQVEQPRYAPSPCPAWNGMLQALATTDDANAVQHARRCDPCNTMWCLHRSRRTALLGLPSIAALANFGTLWVREPPARGGTLARVEQAS